MKKVLSIILAITLALSMTTGFVFADSSDEYLVDYTEIDYSEEVIVNDTDPYNLTLYSDDEYVDTMLWCGNAFGVSVDLEGGEEYYITFTTSNYNGVDAELENRIIVLTPDEFASEVNYDTDTDGTIISVSGDFVGMSHGSRTDGDILREQMTFTPETSGTYKLLCVCWMEEDEVECYVTVRDELVYTEIGEIEYEWASEVSYNDYSTLALGPNGELAVADYYSENGTDSDADFYLRVYNPDGTVKFKSAMANQSDATPVFDEDGNVYIATYTREMSNPKDILGGGITPVIYEGFIQKFDNDGNEVWTTTLIDDDSDEDYACWYPLYVIDDVLVVRFDGGIAGFDTATGNFVWEYKGIDCEPGGQPDAGMAVNDGIIYLGVTSGLIDPIEHGADSDSFVGYDTDSDTGDISLKNAVIRIDAVTGDFYGCLNGFCGSPCSSRFVFDDSNLYFICSGETIATGLDPIFYIEDDTETDTETDSEIYAENPLYKVDLQSGQISAYDIGLDSSDDYVLGYMPSIIFATDNCGNVVYVPILGGKIYFGSIPFNLGDGILGYNDGIKIGDTVVEPSFFNYAEIVDFAYDSNNSMYIILSANGGYENYLFRLKTVTSGEAKSEVKKAVETSYQFELLPLKHIYGSKILVTDTHVYVEGGNTDSVYAIRYADDPVEDTDTDKMGSDSDSGSGAGDDTDVEGGETSGAEDTETDIETNSGSDTEPVGYLKGDINGDGIVDILDVVLARAHIVGNIVLEADQLKRGDMNDDNTLDIIDVVMIRKAIVEKK